MPSRSDTVQPASFDSSTALVRATARVLQGDEFGILGRRHSALLRPLAVAANGLPVRMRQLLYAAGSGRERQAADAVARVDAEHLAQVGLADYLLPRAPGAPSRTVPRRRRGIGHRCPRPLLERNPGLVLHQMADPNNDRLTLRHFAYFRLKRTAVGEAWERFLADRLAPGATIVVADCAYRWPQAQVGERHRFQVGGAGALDRAECREGSPRVRKMQAACGSGPGSAPGGGWDVP